ncbi:MAG: choice-of-anchor D domain-containing protein [Ignavibacteriae bacterium]|nr:choice-of-anchor D domain-containing protein [Ignavibacteriota bacterium]
MSQRSLLVFSALLALVFSFRAIAQERPEDPQWNVRSSVQMKTAETSAPARLNTDFRPNTTPRVANTPQGVMVVEPNVRPRPNTTYHQSEVNIAAQASNRNIMFGASHNIRSSAINVATFITTNGGQTWYGGDTLADYNTQRGDPAPIIDYSGIFIYGHLNSTANFGSVTGMGMNRSTNKGITWEATIPITNAGGSDADKNAVGTDDSPASPFFGNTYMAWTKFTAGNVPAVILVTRTTDHGASWSTAAQVNTAAATTFSQGTDVAVAPNGDAYICWVEESTTSPYPSRSVGFAKSTNGGVNWTFNNTAYATSGMRSSSYNGWAVRVNDFPRMAVDKTGGGRSGWIYIVEAEQGLAPAGTDADIIFHRSTDGGTTWSAGIRANQDALNNGKKQFFPSVCVDAGGGINVAYYDNRNYASTGDSCEIYMSRSLDGGNTWVDVKVSDHAFKPKNVPGVNSMGDYMGIAAGNGKVWPMWMDDRSGFYDVWTSGILTTESFGWVKGIVTNTSGGGAVSGANIDFVQTIPQVQTITNATGNYLAGARVDTPGTTANLTLRARLFGFRDTTIAVTLTRNDTLTRNFQMTPAAGGTLAIHAYRAPNVGMRAAVTVNFNGTPVINNFTDSLTGNFSAPLPTGTYQVIVNPASPYATRTFNGVVINAGQTTNVDALLRSVVEFNPTAVRDTLPVGGSHVKTLAMTNTTTDTVRFRITDDNALARVKRNRVIVPEPAVQVPAVERPKGAPDTEFGQTPDGRGGPDAFGYSWIDSDEPGGPAVQYYDIRSVGTQITTMTSGSLDDGYATITLPWSFVHYGNTYTSMNVGTNGFVNFGTGSTSLSNGAIPSVAAPNNAIYAFWDDLDLRTRGKLFYYNDVANSRFIVQWDSIPRYNSGGAAAEHDTLEIQIVFKPNGEYLLNYRKIYTEVPGDLATHTIGVENAAGTVGLQVVNNAAYLHSNLTIRVFLPDAPWLSENPTLGAIPPSGTQNVQVTFDATGLTPGTTYNANMFVEATHPDVTTPYTVPASLLTQTATNPLIVLNKTSITFPTVAIGQFRRDTITARNVGGQVLNITSITRTNTDFAVTPSSANVNPNDSVKIIVTYTPTVPAGADTGRVTIVSNSSVNPTAVVTLSANSIGVPVFRARVDSLTKTLQARNVDSTLFYVRNTGTMSGNFNARAVMYPRTEAGDNSEPIIIPMNIEKAAATPRTSSVNDQDRAPSLAHNSPLALGDTLFSAPLYTSANNVNQQGIEYANGFFWTTNRGPNPSVGTNYTLKFTFNPTTKRFTIVDSVLQQSTSEFGYRDLAFDGTYLYGSEGLSLKQINATTGVETGVSINVTGAGTIAVLRALAYDPVGDLFYAADFGSSIIAFNRSGVVTRTIPNPGSPAWAFYGFAWDSWSTGGPYLWGYVQNGTPAISLVKILVSSGAVVQSWQGFTPGPTTDVAGGATIVPGLLPGKLVFVGVNQSTSVTAYDAGPYSGGGGTGPWLAIAPPTGTIAVNDSVQMKATFDARDLEIVNNPGTYRGRVEITATNSALADSLNIPVRFTVTPITGAALLATPDSIGFGNVAIGVTDSSKTFLVKNIGTSTLNVTNITSSNAAFSVNRTSFTLSTNDTTRIRVRFTAPTPAGLRTANLTFVSNDAGARPVKVTGTSIGQANIVVSPDSFSFALNRSADTTRATLKIKNTGTDTLRFNINEVLNANDNLDPQPIVVHEHYDLPKGAIDTHTPYSSPDGQGGPDAFGYRWIDSDEPGGPVYNWVDITSTGTPLDSGSAWVATGTFTPYDEGYYPVRLPFTFNYYGVAKDSIFIGTNGYVSFQRPSANAFSNTQFPTAGGPLDNVLGPWWDDLEVSQTAKIYYGTNSGDFVILFKDIRIYTSAHSGPADYTFQVILSPSGVIKFQYQAMGISSGTLISSSIGQENATGTVGLSVAFNAAYMHNNLAIILSSDLVPWLSVDRTSGTIRPGDSTNVQLRIVPNIAQGVYIGRERISGNTPVVKVVPVRLAVTDTGSASVAVTAPNGGENWTIGSVRQITWNHVRVDTVKIEYSTNNGTNWIQITPGVPARPDPIVHPKSAAGFIGGGISDDPMGTYSWTVPAPASTTCLVRVSQKSNASVFDVSNAVFTISTGTTPADTSWAIQPSGSTAAFYTVKAVDQNIVWVGGTGGTVLRTTNGGTNWTSVGGGALGTADVYAIEARDANNAWCTTTPSATFIYRTTNGGALWTQVYTLATPGFIDGIIMTSATNGYAVGDPVPNPGGNWTLLKTTDAGATWAAMTPALPQVGTEAGWNNSFQIIGNNMWFGTNLSKVYRSTNLGGAWTGVATPSLNSYSVWFNNATTGILGGASGAVNKSTNGGATWTAATAAGTGNVLGSGGVNGFEFWATSGNNVFYTTNHGTSWTSAAKNGYTGAIALNALAMIPGISGSTWGWAVGGVAGTNSTIVRYRRMPTSITDGASEIPTVFALDQNYPNPFNPTTTIRFALPEQATVSLKIYNLLGQQVTTLAEGEMDAAFHNVVWNGRNANGAQVATGMYFYRMTATGASGETFTSLKKLILIK